MMLSKVAVVAVLGLLVLIALTFAIFRLVKIVRRNGYEYEMNMLFKFYWNHSSEDELYAWYKVRHLLLQRDDKKQKIRFVNRKISEINKRCLCGAMSISEDGELIDEAMEEGIE